MSIVFLGLFLKSTGFQSSGGNGFKSSILKSTSLSFVASSLQGGYPVRDIKERLNGDVRRNDSATSFSNCS